MYITEKQWQLNITHISSFAILQQENLQCYPGCFKIVCKKCKDRQKGPTLEDILCVGM